MVDYKLDIMYDLRKYLWESFVNLGIFDPQEYYSDSLGQEIVPILPIQQSAEMNQFLSGKKHIVYDKIGMSFEDNWLISCEQLLFTIYSSSITELGEIRNMMTDLFRRMDESGQDMYRWEGLSDKFKVYSIFIADISPTGPSEEIQGFLSADIVLEIKYSRHVGADGRFL